MSEAKTAERADLDITIKGDWRHSGLKVEGVNLPVTEMELSCEVNNWSMLRLEAGAKQTTTVVEGYLVQDPERAWIAEWNPQWLRMEFAPKFNQCQISLDGEAIYARAMWARLRVPEPTEVGFTRLVFIDNENTPGPPLRGFHGGIDHEVTGYLLDDPPEKH